MDNIEQYTYELPKELIAQQPLRVRSDARLMVVDRRHNSLSHKHVRDLPEILDRLMPPGRDYGHEEAWHDGNAHSHLQATTLGSSLTVPITDGKLVLGTWQQIFHLECDTKPRRRTIVVTVYGE